MTLRSALALLILLGAPAAHAASAAALLDRPVRNLQGERVGTIEDLIIDARAGRVLYVIVQGDGRFLTLPARALHPGRLVDMSLAGAVAYDRPPSRERFRRADELIGDEIRHPGEGPIGIVHDIRFDAASGKVQEVIVRSAQTGERSLDPAVLAWGFLPPLTPRPYDAPRYSKERKRLHDHRWK